MKGHWFALQAKQMLLFLQKKPGKIELVVRPVSEQFLADPRLILWRSQGTVMADKCRLLWDQLGSLWVSVVLNPDVEKGGNSIGELVSRLRQWSKSDVCPWEDPDYRHSNGPSGTQNVFPNQETQLNQGHHPHNHQRSHGDNSEQNETTEEASSSAGWTGMIWASQKRRPILGPDPCYSCPALPGDRVSRRSSNGGQQVYPLTHFFLLFPDGSFFASSGAP